MSVTSASPDERSTCTVVKCLESDDIAITSAGEVGYTGYLLGMSVARLRQRKEQTHIRKEPCQELAPVVHHVLQTRSCVSRPIVKTRCFLLLLSWCYSKLRLLLTKQDAVAYTKRSGARNRQIGKLPHPSAARHLQIWPSTSPQTPS